MLSGRIALLLSVVLFFVPSLAHAINMQADAQCQAGGVVGQPCRDVTNGFVTMGTCTHINVCKANSSSGSPPKGCGSTSAPTADCPRGPTITASGPPRSTSTPVVVPIGFSPINQDIFDQAFSEITDDDASNDFVSTTSINGIEYFVSEGETLQAGAPLTEEQPKLVPPSRTMLSLGSVYGLKPVQASGEANSGSSVSLGYAPPSIGKFTSGQVQYSPPIDFFGQMARLGQNFFAGITSGLERLFGIGPEPAGEKASPPLSLYDQVRVGSTFGEHGARGGYKGIWQRIGDFFNELVVALGASIFPAIPR